MQGDPSCRNALTITETLENLSILDAGGIVDKKLEPSLPDDLLLDLCRAMVRGRAG